MAFHATSSRLPVQLRPGDCAFDSVQLKARTESDGLCPTQRLTEFSRLSRIPSTLHSDGHRRPAPGPGEDRQLSRTACRQRVTREGHTVGRDEIQPQDGRVVGTGDLRTEGRRLRPQNSLLPGSELVRQMARTQLDRQHAEPTQSNGPSVERRVGPTQLDRRRGSPTQSGRLRVGPTQSVRWRVDGRLVRRSPT